MKIVLLGAGNVATHLGLALKDRGFQLLQVYSRTESAAKAFSELLGVPYCFKLSDLNKDADIYIYSIKDSALEEIIGQTNTREAIHIHTAGSISIDIFEKYKKNYGVLYPLQTFSKNKKINMEEVPFFIEGNNAYSTEIIFGLARRLSPHSYFLNSEKRMLMHLAAVFACNFSNYMYVLASQITLEAEMDFKTLLPLIKETADKLNYLSPAEAQTGPAVRKDEKTIKKHYQILEKEPDLQQVYLLLSQSIEKTLAKK